ncbi:MAG: DUF1697 domain-containing protein [Thermoanaerobaculia bacterium]
MKFVALLRGVNVGGANKVPMAALRALLEDLGYTGVVTLLNSGNAVFETSARSSRAHAKKIQDALSERIGVAVPVIVKSVKEIDEVIADCALEVDAADHSKLLVAFTGDPEALDLLSPIVRIATPPERAQLGDHALYLLCGDGMRNSKAAAALLGKAGRSATTRNWATVLKIAQLLKS